MKNLQSSLQTNTELTLLNEVSIYKGELTTGTIINGVAKIKKAFPLLPMSFYEVLDERFNDNKFTDERLKDAINHVIDTCIFPTPTVAQFISFDKKYKVFTGEQMLKKMDEQGSEIRKCYRVLDVPELVYVHINDVKKYNLNVKP